MSLGRADGIRPQFHEAVLGFVELLRGIGDGDMWSQPALGDWDLRDLAGHTGRALLTLESYLDPGHRITEPDLSGPAAYLHAAAASLANPAAVAARGREAGAALGDRPADAVAAAASRVLTLVDGSPDDALVSTPVGKMTLAGYLPTRTFELVVHTLDLAKAASYPSPDRLSRAIPGCLQIAAELAADRADAAEALLAFTGRRALPAGYSVI